MMHIKNAKQITKKMKTFIFCKIKYFSKISIL